MVEAVFLPWYDIPDPIAFQPHIDHLTDAMSYLNDGTQKPAGAGAAMPIGGGSELSAFPTTGEILDMWRGPAAFDFTKNVIWPFPTILRRQYLMVGVVATLLEAEQSIWAAARQDIATVAENTLNALDALHSGTVSFSFAMTVLAGLGTMVALIPGIGELEIATAVAVVGWNGVAVLASSAGSWSSPTPTQTQISGNNVNDILDSMVQAVQKVVDGIRLSEEQLAVSINSALYLLQGDVDLFRTFRPSLVTMTSRNYHDYLGDDMGSS